MKLQIKALVTSLSFTAILVLSLFLIKSNINTDNSTQVVFSNDNAATSDESQPEIDNGFSPTAIPLPEEKERRITIFLDKDTDGRKGEDEKSCGRCFDSVVVVTANEVLPNNLSRENVSLVGKAGSIDFANNNLAKNVWGYLPDFDLLIPYTELQAEADPIYVPSIKVLPAIGGINANIQSISIEDTGDSLITTYRLIDFVPLLKSYTEEDSKVWIQFTPGAKSPNQYYLVEAELVNEEGTTGGYIEANWDFIEIPEDFDNTAKIKIIIPEFE